MLAGLVHKIIHLRTAEVEMWHLPNHKIAPLDVAVAIEAGFTLEFTKKDVNVFSGQIHDLLSRSDLCRNIELPRALCRSHSNAQATLRSEHVEEVLQLMQSVARRFVTIDREDLVSCPESARLRFTAGFHGRYQTRFANHLHLPTVIRSAGAPRRHKECVRVVQFG